MADPHEQSTSLGSSGPADIAPSAATRVEQPTAGKPASASPSPVLQSLHGLWTLLVRLIILGAGISLGWVVGVLVAQIFPARNPEPPLQEVVMRHTGQTWSKVRQLPQWWQGSAPVDAVIPSADVEVGTRPDAEVTPRLTLSPELQQQVEQDLALLQRDLAALESRLEDLETSLGETSDGTVEIRLRQLDQLLNPPDTEAAPSLPAPPASPEEATAGERLYTEPPFSPVTDSIVLPSSLLFEPGDSLLTPTGKQLLNTIVPDLQRYPLATLVLGSHTDSSNGPQASRKLTFQQALAVQRYLEQQLGETGIHWVTVGYGHTRPRVSGNSPQAQQRNQRVEIGIVPR